MVPVDDAVGDILTETIGPVKAGKKVKKEDGTFDKLRRYCQEHGIKEVPIVWCPLHVHEAARRKMAKIFLAHLWEVWRKVRGLPTRPPYAIEQLGHKDYLRPFRDREYLFGRNIRKLKNQVREGRAMKRKRPKSRE